MFIIYKQAQSPPKYNFLQKHNSSLIDKREEKGKTTSQIPVFALF